jgi:hypothetical protein
MVFARPGCKRWPLRGTGSDRKMMTKWLEAEREYDINCFGPSVG